MVPPVHATSQASAVPPIKIGPELLRQSVMVLVVGLIVARPLIYGGDPGLLVADNDPSGLVLTLLWLVAAAGWALWRVWARQTEIHAGLVEAGLGVVVILLFGTAYGVAAYQHPAKIIAWEWLAMLVALFLVRQSTVTQEDQNSVLAVVLASAVTMAGFGLYQAYETLPRTQRENPTIDAMLQNPALAKSGVHFVSKDDPKAIAHFHRLQQSNIMGTFAHPNTFAGYLVLVWPALVGAAIFGLRGSLNQLQKVLLVVFAVGGAAALWHTHSRGAFLAIGVIALVGLTIAFWRVLVAHKVISLVCLVLLVAGVLGAYKSGIINTAFGKQEATAAVRAQYWEATSQMIREHPWFGFGPGNFGRAYTRFMSESSGEEIIDPHNFVLEMWTTSGVLAVIALLTAIGAFLFYMIRGAWAAPATEAPPARPIAGAEDLPPPRWTFYIGGIFGLLVSFVLRASNMHKDEVTYEAIIAGLESLLWFGSFALFEQIRWTGRGKALVLTGGIAALLINLLVSGGLGVPQLATLLWVMVALALNTFPTPGFRGLSSKPLMGYGAAAGVVSVAFAYFIMVMLPVTTTWQALNSNLEDKQLLAKLEAANIQDPGNAQLQSHLANIYALQWGSALQVPGSGRDANELWKKATEFMAAAQRSDPHGKDGYNTDYQIHKYRASVYAILENNRQLNPASILTWSAVQFAMGMPAKVITMLPVQTWRLSGWLGNRSKLEDDAIKFALAAAGQAILEDPATWREVPWDRLRPKEPFLLYFNNYKAEQKSAAEPLERYLPNDPNNALLHLNIAEALYRAEADKEEADRHAARALELDSIAREVLNKDEYAPILSRRLTDRQRKYLEQRLAVR